MSVVWLTSDWHIEHKNAYKWSGNFSSQEEREETLFDNYKSLVRPRDIVWFLGDICLNSSALSRIHELPGDKRIILGNHDTDKLGGRASIEQIALTFSQVHSMVSYKGFWLTHAPMHPIELRGKKNIHGHVHEKSIPDDRYVNACLEVNDFKPIKFQEIPRGCS